MRGRDRQGREGWVTGCGGTFGEYGGAGDIVERAPRFVSHHWSRRGRPTALSQSFVRVADAKDLPDLIKGIALGWYKLDANLARQIFEITERGDAVAQEILTWAGSELGETTNAVIRQLNIQDETFDVVLIGSVFNGELLLIEPLKKTILRFAPNVQFIRLVVPPVTGGVLLGMEQVGLRDKQVCSKLFDSIAKFNKP